MRETVAVIKGRCQVGDKGDRQDMTCNDKPNSPELKLTKTLSDNIEKCMREKAEAKTKREKFADPRDDEMMSETYPDG